MKLSEWAKGLSNSNCKYIREDDPNAINVLPHTYEGWQKYKNAGLESHPKTAELITKDGESVYLFEYFCGVFAAGGGAMVL